MGAHANIKNVKMCRSVRHQKPHRVYSSEQQLTAVKFYNTVRLFNISSFCFTALIDIFNVHARLHADLIAFLL